MISFLPAAGRDAERSGHTLGRADTAGRPRARASNLRAVSQRERALRDDWVLPREVAAAGGAGRGAGVLRAGD